LAFLSLEDIHVGGEGLLEVLSESLEFALVVRNLIDAEDALNGGGGHGVVEVLVLVEPLDAEVVLAAVLEGGVHGSQVLRAAHGRDPSVGRVVDGIIVETKTGGEPSLLDFRVHVVGAVQVSIDFGENSRVDLVVVLLKGVVEHNLQVRVVVEVLSEVLRRGGAVKCDVLQGEGS